MGFWSGLGKGLIGAGGLIAAPFTAGASLATVIPAITGAAGALASGIEGGRAAGRVQEAGINSNQDMLKQRSAALLEDALQNRAQLNTQQKQILENALMNRGGLDLQQRQFALNAPQARARNSVKGDMLANAQDVSIDAGPRVHIPTITGGLRPSMLSGNSRALGSEMSRQALMQQMQGDNFDKMPEMPTFDAMPEPQIPGVTPTPQANGWDTALNTVGAVGAGTGLISQLLGDRYKVKTPPPRPMDEGPWDEQGVG